MIMRSALSYRNYLKQQQQLQHYNNHMLMEIRPSSSTTTLNSFVNGGARGSSGSSSYSSVCALQRQRIISSWRSSGFGINGAGLHHGSAASMFAVISNYRRSRPDMTMIRCFSKQTKNNTGDRVKTVETINNGQINNGDNFIKKLLDPLTNNFSCWFKWIASSFLAIATLPLWQKKWQSLLKIEEEVESAVKTVEQVVDVVEKVAEVTERVSSELAQVLPDNNGMKNAVLAVEHISEEAIKDAQFAKKFIHEIGEAKEIAGTAIEPVIEEVNKHAHHDQNINKQ